MDSVAKFDFGKVTLEFVERPNETLSAEYRSSLVQECIPAARSAFDFEGVTASDIETHAMEVSFAIFVRDPSGGLIGFASSFFERVQGRDFVYLEGTALRKECQGQGLYIPLVALRVLAGSHRNASAPLVATRTQTPVVFKMMTEKFGLFPRLSESVPDALKDLAEDFAGVVRENHSDFKSAAGLDFDRNHLVVRRAYGRQLEDGTEEGVCMYGPDDNKIPWLEEPKDSATNRYIRDHLSHQNGDAFLMIGEFDESRTVAALRASVGGKTGVSSDQIERILQSWS